MNVFMIKAAKCNRSPKNSTVLLLTETAPFSRLKQIFFYLQCVHHQKVGVKLENCITVSYCVDLHFSRKDSFKVICGTYLGRLTKIRIGHDNSGLGPGWFLNKASLMYYFIHVLASGERYGYKEGD